MTRVVALLLTSAVTFAQAGTGGQKPVFRSRTDLVHLDVSVLDENRRPVRV
jgi:hypothetical protein